MNIKRARGHRLYTTNGDKILDLSMDYGRAVIGHRPNGLSLTLKSVIDRGIYASYDSVYLNRLSKYLQSKFAEHKYITIFNSECKVVDKLKCQPKDPLFENCNGAELAYWRPFLDTPDADNIIVLYPIPGLNSVVIVVSKSDLEIKSDMVSPVLLAGVLRSLNDYDAALKDFDPGNYSIYSSVPETRLLPPYLVFNRKESEYKDLCCRALKEGILLNSELQVAILPPDYSVGETKKVLNVLNKPGRN